MWVKVYIIKKKLIANNSKGNIYKCMYKNNNNYNRQKYKFQYNSK